MEKPSVHQPPDNLYMLGCVIVKMLYRAFFTCFESWKTILVCVFSAVQDFRWATADTGARNFENVLEAAHLVCQGRGRGRCVNSFLMIFARYWKGHGLIVIGNVYYSVANSWDIISPRSELALSPNYRVCWVKFLRFSPPPPFKGAGGRGGWSGHTSNSQPHSRWRLHRRRNGVEDVLETPRLLPADVLPEVIVLDALLDALGAEIGRDAGEVLVVAQEALVEPVHLSLRPRRRRQGRRRRRRHQCPLSFGSFVLRFCSSTVLVFSGTWVEYACDKVSYLNTFMEITKIILMTMTPLS